MVPLEDADDSPEEPRDRIREDAGFAFDDHLAIVARQQRRWACASPHWPLASSQVRRRLQLRAPDEAPQVDLSVAANLVARRRELAGPALEAGLDAASVATT